MSKHEVEQEIQNVFATPMLNRSDFPFFHLQPGSRTLTLPSVFHSFHWTPQQVAKLRSHKQADLHTGSRGVILKHMYARLVYTMVILQSIMLNFYIMLCIMHFEYYMSIDIHVNGIFILCLCQDTDSFDEESTVDSLRGAKDPHCNDSMYLDNREETKEVASSQSMPCSSITLYQDSAYQ